MNDIENFFRQISVIEILKPKMTLRRIGGPNDGGYVILDEVSKKTESLVSFGIGDDCDFELDFVTYYKTEQAYLHDPHIFKIPKTHPSFHFTASGIESAALLPMPMQSTLKCDVEGAEWTAFENMPYTEMARFMQMVVEFHIFYVPEPVGLSPYFTELFSRFAMDTNEILFHRYYRVMRKIREMFHIFHIHANNSLPLVTVGGMTFPPLLEVSFVRKDIVETFQFTDDVFPRAGLDSPNKTDREDVHSYYPFDRRMKGEAEQPVHLDICSCFTCRTAAYFDKYHSRIKTLLQ